MVPATVGWIIWRDQSYLSQKMVYRSSYLAGVNEQLTLSFSLPSTGVLVQYYHFLSLGHDGFRAAIQRAMTLAAKLSSRLDATGWFRCLGDASSADPCSGSDMGKLPVVAFALSRSMRTLCPELNESSLSMDLIARGLSVPCTYDLRPNSQLCRIFQKKNPLCSFRANILQ